MGRVVNIVDKIFLIKKSNGLTGLNTFEPNPTILINLLYWFDQSLIRISLCLTKIRFHVMLGLMVVLKVTTHNRSRETQPKLVADGHHQMDQPCTCGYKVEPKENSFVQNACYQMNVMYEPLSNLAQHLKLKLDHSSGSLIQTWHSISN